MTLQDSCDTLYESTRKLVFEIEENRCAVTGAAALGGENTDRSDEQSVFLTGMVDLPLRGINLDSTYPHQIKSTNHLTVIGTFWWGMVDSNHRRRCQQIYSLSPLATREIPHIQFWSWWTDSNPRPADYKSAALPAELHQHFSPAEFILADALAFVNIKVWNEPYFLHTG